MYISIKHKAINVSFAHAVLNFDFVTFEFSTVRGHIFVLGYIAVQCWRRSHDNAVFFYS